MNPKIDKIAKQLEQIINTEVEAQAGVKDTRFEELFSDVKHYYETAKENIKEYKKESLSVNAIEAEGYLRGITTIKNLMEAYNKYS